MGYNHPPSLPRVRPSDVSSLIYLGLFLSILSGAVVNEGMTADTIQNDLDVARQLLRQTQEQLYKLELKVSRLKSYQ